MIEKLSEDREEFIRYTNMFGLNKKVMELVNMANQLEEINGKRAKDVWEECQRETGEFEAYSPNEMPNSEEVRTL